jgi:septal ring factor EnvC (AmiA/AmiB activator)
VAAVFGMLTVQLLAILLVGWRMATPVASAEPPTELKRLADLIEQQNEQAGREMASTAKLQVLDRLLAQHENLPANVATQLAEQEEQLAQLRAAVQGLDAAQRDARQQLSERERELVKVRSASEVREQRLQRKLDEALASLDTTRERYRKLAAEMDLEEEGPAGEAAGKPYKLFGRLPIPGVWMGGLAIAVIVVGVVLSTVLLRRRSKDPSDWERER